MGVSELMVFSLILLAETSYHETQESFCAMLMSAVVTPDIVSYLSLDPKPTLGLAV